MEELLAQLMVRGSKGGGGKGKGGGDDASNTLRSKARARFIEVISEGECEGLVDGDKSIYFGETPVRNADGTLNFKNVLFQQHVGLPEEGFFTGNAQVETPEDVEVQVKKSTGAVARTIVEPNATALRIITRLPALVSRDNDDGTLQATSVSYAIDVRPNGGAWTEVLVHNLSNEKCTSVVQFKHRVELPDGGCPWDVRMRRLTDDSTDTNLQNDTWWESYIVLVEGKFSYPHTGAVAQEVNAEDMGQSGLPSRAYRWRGIKCEVPTNYDPIAKTYTGIWDGTFKHAWTSCPPWIFREMVVNDRWGLGEFVNAAHVDKWSLYTIGQYCDQKVPSGYKDPEGDDILEPRYAFNGVINTRDQAFFVLQQMTSVWRGMGFWCLGQVFATADMPADAVKIVSKANVIGGRFAYSGTSKKARHSVAIVKWNDPADFYRPSTEVVINQKLLARYGWREKVVQLRGCTSRGQAHRQGKWILDVEENETETLTYRASWDHADIRPGEIVAVADSGKAQVRFSGRLLSVNDTTVVMDGGFAPGDGQTYEVMIAMPDGSIETRGVTAFSQTNVANDTLTIASGLPGDPVSAAMFVIKGTDISPRYYRVLTREESKDKKNEFVITALFHDPNKYARVEQGVIFDPLPYYRPPNVMDPPINLDAVETSYLRNGAARARITFSWAPGPGGILASSYRLGMQTPNDGFVDLGSTARLSHDIDDIEAGDYTFYVTAIGFGGIVSRAAELEFSANGAEGIPLGTVTNLQLVDRPGQSTFVGRDAHIAWQNNFATTSASGVGGATPSAAVSPLYRHNTIKIYANATNTLLRTQTVTENRFNYTWDMNRADTTLAAIADPARAIRFEVTVTDIFGRTSVAASAVFSNPVPGAIAPTVTVGGDVIYVRWDQPTDADLRGVLVWLETTSGYNPVLTTPAADTRDSSVTLKRAPNTAYYLRIAGYDEFGKTGLNISTQQTVNTTTFEVDTTAPGTPTGLALSSVITMLANGGQEVRLTATWNANGESDLAGYMVEIKEGAGNYVGFDTNTNRYEWVVKPGVSYTVRVQAYDRFHNKSAFTAGISHTAATDGVAPATPTGFTATGAVKMISLKWNANTEADFREYEIYEAATTTAPVAGTAATYSTRAIYFLRGDLAAALTRYYWIRAVDTSGNKSAWSAMQTATTQNITAIDIDAVIAATSYAASIQPPRVVTSLPALPYAYPKVFRSTDSTFWIQNATGTAWVRETDASQIIGQLIGTQIANSAIVSAHMTDLAVTEQKIAASAITTAKIAAAAVDASKMVNGVAVIESFSSLPATGNFAGRVVFLTTDQKLYRHKGTPTDATGYTAEVAAVNITGTLTAAQIASVNAASVAGQLTAAQIASITAAQVTGQLTAAQIASIAATQITGTLVANQIADGVLTAAKMATGNIIVESFASLPATGNYAGRMVFLTSDQKLYRHKGTPTNASGFTAEVAATNITGQLTAAQIDTVNAAQIAGQLTAAQIASIAATQVTGQITSTQITDNAITTAKIAANAIQAGHLSAGSVTAAAILAGTITTTQIAASTIQGSNIAAGTIVAGNIAAATITGTQVATGTLTATHIQAASITGDRMVANTITAGLIQAGAINSDHISANSIRTSHLVVTNFTNLAPNPILATASLADYYVFAGGANVSVVSISHPSANRAIRFLANGAQLGVFSHDGAYGTASGVSVTPGEEYRIAVDAIATAAVTSGTPEFMAWFFAADGTSISASTAIPIVTAGGWNTYSGNVTVPAGTAYMRLYARWTGTSAGGPVFITNFIINRRNTGAMIVDGAIVAAHISANQINATHLAANSVTAAAILAGTITTTQIAAATIVSANIAVGTIVAANIAAGTITTTQIAAATILAANIAAGTIVAGNIAALTITGDKISANTLTGDKIQANQISASHLTADSVTAGKIAANAVQAAHIAAGQIQAAHVAAGAITTAALDALSVTAGKIAAGAIQTTHITAGAVVTASIAAGAITSTLLSANSVQAAHIAAGQVNATHIQANSITAGQIAAGAIGADQIAANAIAARHLLVGDASNLAPNGNFLTGTAAGWKLENSPSATAIVARGAAGVPASCPSSHCAQFTPNGTHVTMFTSEGNHTNPNEGVPVVGGEQYYLSINAAKDAGTFAGTFQIWAYFTNPDGTNSSVASANLLSTITTSWQTLSINATVPAGATRLKLFVSWLSTGASTGKVFFTNASILRRNTGNLIVDGVIQANHLAASNIITLSAQIGTAIINNAHIANLDAAKITTGSLDAARIAAGSITTDKITISGGTTLSDWRQGGDLTNIAGGKISANTIAANAMQIGQRGLDIEGLEFEHNKDAANKLAWTTGTIRYTNDAGVLTSAAITANATGTLWSTGIMYVYWTKGGTTLSTTTTYATANTASTVILATYQGGTNLNANYGRTIVDGGKIKTGTITATQIAANAIVAAAISAGAIQTGHLAAGAITADKLSVGVGSNWLNNADFSAGTANWKLTDSSAFPGATLVTVTPISNNFHIGANVLSLGHTSGTAADDARLDMADPNGTTAVRPPVVVGQRYQFAVYLFGVGSQAQLGLAWYDKAGAVLSTSTSTAMNPQGGHPSNLLGSYSRQMLFATAPASAVTVRPYVKKFGTTTGGGGSNLYIARPFFAEATVNQTDPTPWAPSGGTLIGGGHIQTQSIGAGHIQANSISASHINAGEINGTHIAANTITATHLNVTSLSAINANLGTVTAGVIQGAAGKAVFDLNAGTLIFSD